MSFKLLATLAMHVFQEWNLASTFRQFILIRNVLIFDPKLIGLIIFFIFTKPQKVNLSYGFAYAARHFGKHSMTGVTHFDLIAR